MFSGFRSSGLRTLGLAFVLATTFGCPAAEEDDHGDEHESEDHGHDDHSHDETGHDHGNESEVITTVTLTFAPQGGGDPVVATFADPDGDGGMSGTADPIALTAGTTYDLSITFLNELESPAEDITVEIAEEAAEHQVFIAGSAVSGPATGDDPAAPVVHAYADMDANGLPLGLANTITAAAAGSGTFDVQLQHLPELNGAAQKTAGLAEELAMGTPLPGDADAAVSFELTVQ